MNTHRGYIECTRENVGKLLNERRQLLDALIYLRESLRDHPDAAEAICTCNSMVEEASKCPITRAERAINSEMLEALKTSSCQAVHDIKAAIRKAKSE